MQTDQLLVHEDTPIRDVLSAMLARNEKMAVVVNARDELVGVIDRADLLRGIMLGERR
jgi:predicted transcriptional regulator